MIRFSVIEKAILATSVERRGWGVREVCHTLYISNRNQEGRRIWLMASEVSVHGDEGMIDHHSLDYVIGRQRPRMSVHARLSPLSCLGLLCHQPLGWCHHTLDISSPPSYTPWRHPRRHPEVYFTNPLDASQFNKVGSQDYLS